jgi:hypothetical protein
MRGRLARDCVPAAVAALLVLGLGGPFALGGKKLKTKSATTTVAADENGSATATCKRGTKAVSGGFETEFSLPPVNFPFIPAYVSRREGARAWTSSGFNDGDSDGDLTSFAYCRDQKLTAVTDTVAAPVGQFATAAATCPRRTRVISGGFAGSPIDLVGTTPVLYISESRRATKRTWEASAHSNGNEDGELTAIAYCGKGKRLRARSASAMLGSDPPAVETAEILARCKRKERVVSGAFGSTDASGEATPRVLTSMREGKRGWAVTAFVGSNGMPAELTAYAYCERKR